MLEPHPPTTERQRQSSRRRTFHEESTVPRQFDTLELDSFPILPPKSKPTAKSPRSRTLRLSQTPVWGPLHDKMADNLSQKMLQVALDETNLEKQSAMEKMVSWLSDNALQSAMADVNFDDYGIKNVEKSPLEKSISGMHEIMDQIESMASWLSETALLEALDLKHNTIDQLARQLSENALNDALQDSLEVSQKPVIEIPTEPIFSCKITESAEELNDILSPALSEIHSDRANVHKPRRYKSLDRQSSTSSPLQHRISQTSVDTSESSLFVDSQSDIRKPLRKGAKKSRQGTVELDSLQIDPHEFSKMTQSLARRQTRASLQLSAKRQSILVIDDMPDRPSTNSRNSIASTRVRSSPIDAIEKSVAGQKSPQESNQDLSQVFLQAMAHQEHLEQVVLTKSSSFSEKKPIMMEASPIFDTLIDTEQPMNILRIESLNPVPVDPFDFGKFCVADCYIILVKLEEFQLYTWIGSDAEIDKKFCCAMFAVGLRNFLEAKCKIQRETEGDESLEFLSLFPVFEYQDSSNAAESGLYVTQEKQYPTRLYKIKGKNEMQLELCNPHPSSLLEENVYLLDCGLELYQWNGGKSTLSHRSKCRIICARIIKGDRAGKAVFVEMDQGQESEQFLEHLDGLPLDERVFDYEVGLYKIDAQKTLEEQRISEKLSRELLDKGNCYIVDAGTELFFWMGKDSLPRDRLDATLVLAKLIESKERPSWVALHRCAQDNEPEVFKLRFSDWEKKSQQSLPSIRQQTSRPSIRGDILSLYDRMPSLSVDPLLIEETKDHANAILETFTSFVYYKGRFVQLDESDQGHLFSSDAYVFLCVYKIMQEEELIQSPGDRRMSTRRSIYETETPQIQETLECLVYFWQGRHCSKLAKSTFHLKTLLEMENLVKQMYHCPIRVVHLDQGKEAFALLAHLQNHLIIHKGSRNVRMAEKKAYQIRRDVRYLTLRAVEVDPQSLYLTPLDALLVFSLEKSYLWMGSELSDQDRNAVELLAEQILLKYGLDIGYQLNAPDFEQFCQPQYGSSANGRFLLCGAEQGFLKCEEIPFFTQHDLKQDCCVILDTEEVLFLWMGSSASEYVRVQSDSILSIWAHKKNEKQRFKIEKMEQGKESMEFKGLFLGWDPVLLEEPLNLFLREKISV